MWLFDVGTLRFLAVNDAAVRQYGYTRRELLQMTILEIRPPGERARVMRALERAARDDVHAIWQHRRKSGDVFEAETHWQRFTFDGRAVQLVLAVDVSRRLQRFAGELVRVQEAERRDLARELHDEIGQTLTGLKLTLQMVPRLPPPEAAIRLSWAESLVEGLMRQIRELSLNLRPSVLDDLGLLPGILWHIDRFTAQTGVRVAFTHAGIDRRLPAEIETAAFRIVQEALTNVARHAGVTEARLVMRVDRGALTVTVEDQGRGFTSSESPASGAGLAGMRERAAMFGGTLRVDAAAPHGTRVAAVLPLAERLGRAGRA